MALKFDLYHKAQNTGPNDNLTIGTYYRVQEIQTTTDGQGNINYDLPDTFNEAFVTVPGEFKVRVTDTGTLSTYDGEPFTMFAETSITDIVTFKDLITGLEDSQSTDFEGVASLTKPDGWALVTTEDDGTPLTPDYTGVPDPALSSSPDGTYADFGVVSHGTVTLGAYLLII